MQPILQCVLAISRDLTLAIASLPPLPREVYFPVLSIPSQFFALAFFQPLMALLAMQ